MAAAATDLLRSKVNLVCDVALARCIRPSILKTRNTFLCEELASDPNRHGTEEEDYVKVRRRNP